MATMFPADVTVFTTPGEKKVYTFLRQKARPDALFLAWYSPDIEDREPDFILYSPDCGLIVLEVKDWLGSQVLEADPKTALLRMGGRDERRKQPLAQAREYVNHLLSLLGRNLKDKTQIPCPITWGAVFPHITRKEFEQCGLNVVMEGRRVLCADEIGDASPLVRDVSGQMFRKWLAEHFPPMFPFNLSSGDLNWLRSCIFPVVRLDLPQRGLSSQVQIILAMDHEQENLARHLGRGKLLISGPAGSGKTLILCHQAWHMPRMNKNIKKILITCFNLSLVGYIRRLLAKKGVGLGPGRVEVIPFYSLCERILGEGLAHSSENSDYYELVVSECIERLDKENSFTGRWDAILVDEGQDFTTDMAKVILKLLPEDGVLTVCEDDNQRLYQNDPGVWENLGLKDLRKRRLDCQYRNTRQIAQCAAKVLPEQTNPASLEGSSGPEPVWIEEENTENLVSRVADAVRELADKGVALNEIAVLYVSGKMGDGSLPESLLGALENRGILSRWAARDTASKRAYDISTDSVTISTIHSVKGLDFSHVFLLDLDKLKAERDYDRHLAHVGLTRAREMLFLCVNARKGLASLLV